MSLLFYFCKAWLIGIAVAAPVGPIGALCIRKGLEVGLIGSLAVGLGAAIADSIYGLIAALGLTGISHLLIQKAVYIKLFGGVFLLYLAYKEWKSAPKPYNNPLEVGKNKHLLKLTGSVILLTLTNPMTILSFIGIFASIGGGTDNLHETVAMVVGVFVGSMTWWLILGSIVVKIKHKLSNFWLQKIHGFSALVLAGFGVFAILGSIF